MTGERRGRVLAAVVVALSVAFALAAHAAIVDGLPRRMGALLSLVPLAIVVLVVLRRSGRRWLGIAVLALAVPALWLAWPEIERRFPDIFFFEHTLMNLLLGAVFGRTLLAGHEPLVTRFARIMHPTLPPEVERYTRNLTLAWTLFFAAMLAISWGLYFAGQRAAWSAFATLVNPALVVAMFAIEYAVRLRALPNWEQVGITGSVRAYVRYFQAARAAQPTR